MTKNKLAGGEVHIFVVVVVVDNGDDIQILSKFKIKDIILSYISFTILTF